MKQSSQGQIIPGQDSWAENRTSFQRTRVLMPKSFAFPQEDTEQPEPLRICTCFSSASEDTSEPHFHQDAGQYPNCCNAAGPVQRSRPPHTYCETTGGNFWECQSGRSGQPISGSGELQHHSIHKLQDNVQNHC